VLRLARRPGVGDRLAFGDEVSAPHAERPQVRERGLVPVHRDDRDGCAVRRDLAGERHLAAHGRADTLSACQRDVDPAVLPTGVRVIPKHEPA